jgi:hypothetical protein
MSFRPSIEQLSQIEDKIMVNFPEYLKNDITVALSSFLKMNYYPTALLNEIN